MNEKKINKYAVILVFAAIVVFGSIFLVINNGRRTSLNNIKKADDQAQENQNTEKTIKTAVSSFYDWYIRQNSDVFTSSEFKERGTLTTELVAKIEKSIEDQKNSEAKKDPIICGEGMPDTVDIANVNITGATAIVNIDLNYIKARKVSLEMIQLENQWRISNIICP